MSDFAKRVFDDYLQRMDNFYSTTLQGDKEAREWAFIDFSLAIKELYSSPAFLTHIDWRDGVLPGSAVTGDFDFSSLKYSVLEANAAHGISVSYRNPEDPSSSPLVISCDAGPWQPLVIYDDMGLATSIGLLEVDARKIARYVARIQKSSLYGSPYEPLETTLRRNALLPNIVRDRDAPLPEDIIEAAASFRGSVASPEVVAEAAAARAAAEIADEEISL